jgi:hypothetical protein
VTQGSLPSMMTQMYDMTTNRIDTSGYGYDGNGNLTSAPGHTYTYDVENRMMQDGTGDLYVYDAANRRVANAMATYSIYFYTPDGRKAGTIHREGERRNGVDVRVEHEPLLRREADRGGARLGALRTWGQGAVNGCS